MNILSTKGENRYYLIFKILKNQLPSKKIEIYDVSQDVETKNIIFGYREKKSFGFRNLRKSGKNKEENLYCKLCGSILSGQSRCSICGKKAV